MKLPSKRKIKQLTQLLEQRIVHQRQEIKSFKYKSAEQLFLSNEEIGVEEIEKLPSRHQVRAKAIILHNLNILTGDERDKFLARVTPYLSQTNQNILVKERNHFMISDAIITHIQVTRTFPSISTLTKKTGLSRPTINKHLEVINIDYFIGEEISKLRLVFSTVMGSIVDEAVNGNMQAAKLYLEVMNMRQPTNSTFIKNQQNNTIIK